MSIPTLQGLQTALSGLLSEQQALDVTGNNIANANTEGYSRETAILEPNQPIAIPALSDETGLGAQLGTGVTVADISRIRNIYLDSQYRTQNSALSGASTQTEGLEQAQNAFNEPSTTALGAQLSAFWTAWNNLAQQPSEEPAKEGVLAAGTQLADTFNELSAQLTELSHQAEAQYNALTGHGGEVENDAKQLAELNGQIRLAEGAGEQPNEMLDRRDLLLDKLSSLANVTVTEQPDHTDTVSFGDAAEPLVEGTKVNWPQTLTEAAGGQLGALLGLSGEGGTIASYQAALDNVSETLAAAVNEQLPVPFFATGETGAATIHVVTSSAGIKASMSGVAGANEAARAIAAMRGGAAEQAYGALIERIGSDVRAAKDEQANLQASVTVIGNQRQSVSGVSLDEEMTNLIAFQRGYQASARTLTAMDSMLETLIEHTGTVGL